MTWKFIWQVLFCMSLVMFLLIFFKFTIDGFKDIKKYFVND